MELCCTDVFRVPPFWARVRSENGDVAWERVKSRVSAIENEATSSLIID